MAKQKPNCIRLEVKPNKARDRVLDWMVTKAGQEYCLTSTKQAALNEAALLKDAILIEGGTVSLRIKSKLGKFQREHTYPRSAETKAKG